MKKLIYLFQLFSFRQVVQYICWRLLRELKWKFSFIKSKFRSTYISSGPPPAHPLLSANGLPAAPEHLYPLITNYTEHKFDLLGSGWTEVAYPTTTNGLEGFKYNGQEGLSSFSTTELIKNNILPLHASHSLELAKLLPETYKPIDWQLDFKSGFRWSEKCFHKNIQYGHKPGVDIKVPWELGRMQHLPQMALYYSKCKQDSVAKEVQNQILDFVIQNPPLFGVQWYCAMDVSIRACNWILAYDLLKVSGFPFSDDFNKVFFTSLYHHAKFIINNLEWMPKSRSNHYLSDLCGLIYICTRLQSSKTIDSWLHFAIQSFYQEVEYQFYEEGSNYEASTGYHRLSSEIVIHTLATLQGMSLERRTQVLHAPLANKVPGIKISPLSAEKFIPTQVQKRAYNLLRFLKDTQIHPHEFVQIGDHDSGRLFKTFANYRGTQETLLSNQDTYIDGLNLFAKTEEPSLVSNINKGVCFDSPPLSTTHLHTPHNASILTTFKNNFEQSVEKKKQIYEFVFDEPLMDLQKMFYPQFGLYVYRAKDFYFTFRCGPIGLDGKGGHAHNDQLSITLHYKGVSYIQDPGTYIYTPLIERRNHYRSVSSHFCPQLSRLEPEDLNLGPFILSNRSQARVLHTDDQHLLGAHNGYHDPILRLIELDSKSLKVYDLFMGEGSLHITQDSDLRKYTAPIPLSPSYGEISA